MDLFEAIRVLALRNVVNSRRNPPREGDPEYPLRRIMRWYAREFHVPISEVEQLPLPDLYLAYWETSYEELEDDKLEQERQEVLRDPEEMERIQRLEDEEDAEVFLIAKEEAQKSTAKKLEEVQVPPRDQAVAPIIAGKETELVSGISSLIETPPDIEMKFTDEEIDLDRDSFGLLDPPEGEG